MKKFDRVIKWEEGIINMKKFYRVIKENFLWEEGAILHLTEEDSGYTPINDIFRKHEDCNEYISSKIIENSPEYFERVYPVSLLKRTYYKTKEAAKEAILDGWDKMGK